MEKKRKKKEKKRVLGVFILPLACGNVLLRVTSQSYSCLLEACSFSLP
jgi:hypothetical protein